jgi:mono/diheme cytochrome c family protein
VHAEGLTVKLLGRRAVRVAAAALGLCSFMLAAAPAAHCFPWSIDTYRGPAIQPLEIAPRVMPQGTLPVKAGMPTMTLEAMTVQLHNPYTPTPKRLSHGRDLFDTNCAPCHGATGEGNGPVRHLLHMAPANLATGASKALPDGYIFGYIRNGGFAMPSYDDAMSVSERWDVVMYVRQLQQRAAGKSVANKAGR